MNLEGLRAFEAAHREHMERPAYVQLFGLISEKAREHNVHCRLDALHFLTLNFEFMVAEPLGHQRSGTLAAVMNGELRQNVEQDLDRLFRSLDGFDSNPPSSQPADPSREDFDESPRGVSSGRMLQHVAQEYDGMHISKWRLWG